MTLLFKPCYKNNRIIIQKREKSPRSSPFSAFLRFNFFISRKNVSRLSGSRTFSRPLRRGSFRSAETKIPQSEKTSA